MMSKEILWESIRIFLRSNRQIGETNTDLVYRACNDCNMFSRLCSIDTSAYSNPTLLRSYLTTDEFIKSI